MFNALKYTQELEHAGFSREQAEVSVKILIDVMNESFATKADLYATKSELKSELSELKSELSEVKSELSEVKSELKMEIDSVRNEMRSGFRELEYKLTIKLGGMLIVAVGATATMMKLFQTL